MIPKLSRRLCLLLLSASAMLATQSQAGAENVAFVNGRWFNGAGFKEGALYSVDGVFSESKPEVIGREIDLAGAYAVPPYGEAHNHNLEGGSQFETHMAMYLRDGVFYVMNQNCAPDSVLPIRDVINRRDTADALYSYGGITPSGSHVVELYERHERAGFLPKDWKSPDTHAYFIVDDIADLEAKWPTLIGQKPDFVKIFMGFSEEHEKRKNDPAFYGKRGIDPALVPIIVERAHAAGLRVSAHLETAEDFRIAVKSGVDIIAHMPGCWRYGAPAGYKDSDMTRYEISPEDARLAGERGVAVVTTLRAGKFRKPIRETGIRNLELLRSNGVTIAIGSDNYEGTSISEITALQDFGVFDPLTLLKLLSENTPRVIFPDRRIGALRDGYEASFLALEGNPLDDFSNVGKITLRVKQGVILSPE